MNILEDARIEKAVKRKYPVNLFKKGYAALAARDFFGIAETGVNSCNLIDRINLFFKGQDGVKFSEEEKVFVDRADKLETEDEVLDLAEELYNIWKTIQKQTSTMMVSLIVRVDGFCASRHLPMQEIMVEKLLMILPVLIIIYGLAIILVLMHLDMM